MAWTFNPFTGNFDYYVLGSIVVTAYYLLLETGDYLLLESGDKLILE